AGARVVEERCQLRLQCRIRHQPASFLLGSFTQLEQIKSNAGRMTALHLGDAEHDPEGILDRRSADARRELREEQEGLLLRLELVEVLPDLAVGVEDVAFARFCVRHSLARLSQRLGLAYRPLALLVVRILAHIFAPFCFAVIGPLLHWYTYVYLPP